MSEPHTPATLVILARKHGWTVDVDKARGTAWFRRGPEYAHLGTDSTATAVLSVYGGLQGKPNAAWVPPRGRHAEALAEHLTAPPYRYNT